MSDPASHEPDLSSHSDPHLFLQSVCDKIETLVKSLRRLIRLSVSREDDLVQDSERHWQQVEACLSSLTPLLAVVAKLSMTISYEQVAPVVSCAYDLLRVVLKSLISVSHSLLLDQQLIEVVTLTVPLCLRFEPFLSETREQEVGEEEILELMKSHLQEVPESPAGQLLQLLLDSCLTLPHRRTSIRFNGLTPPATPDSNLSDLSHDSSRSNDGYDADDELKCVHRRGEAVQVLDQWNLIRFPRLAYTLVELLTGRQLRMTSKTSETILVKIMDKLVTWCEECPQNTLILYGSGFTDLIIRSVRDLVSPSATPSDRIVRHFLSLFTAISHNRLQGSDFRSYLSLFKTGSQPPFQILLKPLKDICSQYNSRSPYTCISANTAGVSGIGSRSEDMAEVRLRKSQCEKRDLSCCWTTALMAISLPDSCCSNRSLTFSLWIRVAGLSQCKKGKQTSKQSGMSNGRCLLPAVHLLSLCSGEVSLEVWFCLKKRVLKFRLLSLQRGILLSESDEADPTTEHTLFPDNEWTHVSLTFLLEKEAITKARLFVNGDLRSLTCIANPSELNSLSGKLFTLLGSASHLPTIDLSCVKLFTADLDEVDACLLFLIGPNSPLITLSHEPHMLSEFPADRSLVKYSLVRAFMMQEERLCALRRNVLAEFPLFNRSPGLTCLFVNERGAPLTQHKMHAMTHTVVISSPSLFLSPFCLRDRQDFPIALNDSGGITTQLFLFGALVEGTSDAKLQAEALHFLLSVVNVHSEIQRDFALAKGYAMVNQVILSSACIPSLALFEVYLSQCILGLDADSFLRSPECLCSLYRVWRRWHQLPDAASLIYSSILSLIQRKNRWWECNLKQLREAAILSEMTCMLETSFMEDSAQLSLNGRDVATVSQIFRLVIGSPPELPFIADLVHCLTLLHDSAKAYVCQSKNNMYFLLHDHPADEMNGFANYSIPSTDEWQLIRPVSHVSHETRHNIVFAGLLNTLNDVIADLLPQDVQSVLGPVLSVDHFVVWCNSENGIIRESVLRTLLTTLKKPQAVNFVAEFSKKEGFHLISNQLTQYSASNETLSSLITFILDADRINLCFEDWTLARNWLKVTSAQASAFQAFMSLLLKSQENTSLTHWSLQNLSKLLKSIPNCSHILKYLYDNGLVICLVNLLCQSETNLSRSDHLLDDDVIERDVLSLGETLSAKLISSSGNIFREAFDEAVDLLLLRSLCHGNRREVLRQFLIVLLRTAFDSIEKYASDPKFSSQSSFKDVLQAMTAIISLQFHDSITVAEASNVLEEPEGRADGVGRINLSREEMDFRIRLVIERSIEAVSFRDIGSPCSDIEKFFVRTLLHTLFLNSVGQDSSGRWLPLVNPIRKFLRSKLSLLVVLVLSPLYCMEDRIQFALWISQSIPVSLSCCLSHKQLHIVQSFAPSIIDNCSPDEQDIVNRCLTFKQRNWRVCVDEWLQSLGRTKHAALVKIANRHQSHYIQFEKTADRLVDISASVTQSYVHDQNRERVKYFNITKEMERCTYATKKKWKRLVQSVSHEAHHFHDEASFPQSWQLDPSEGPSRMRRKLMRCHLDIDSRYFDPGFRHKSKTSEIHVPLAPIYSTTDQNTEVSILIDSIHANEQILQTYMCALITPQHEYTGELLLSDTCAHFIGRVGELCKLTPLLRQETWALTDVKEFLERRYQLQDTGLELFLENGNSYLLALTTSSDMKNIVSFLSEKGISQTTEMKSLTGVTRMWREGVITNFDYLMFLNKLAGRSFNDLMIYPVYPFVVSDYKSDVLDLNSADTFRNLSKPMALQQKSRERYYKEQYQYLISEYNRRLANEDATLDPVSCPVYHYGSHYSNSGTVLHFLVRLPPFTQMFLKYQDKNFDIPDRTFHSMNVTWNLSSGDSTTDFKELIPEFFYLPEFLTNLEHFDFGQRHNGIKVDNVNLPIWCRSDPRLFVLINRQALESDFVSRNLHQWIDLIFGYKQSGKQAIEALNVFHPATYYGLEVSKIDDSLKRNALITMIRTFGQMPKQLFKHPHPQRLLSSTGSRDWTESPHVLGEVNGLKWGRFVGSPTEADPVIVFSTPSSSFRGALVPLQTSDIFGLPPDSCLHVSYNFVNRKSANPAYVNSMAIISWKHSDGMIRVRDRMGYTVTPFHCSCLDSVSLCASLSSYGLLFVAYLSGSIAVYSMPAPFDWSSEQSEPLIPTTWLFAHTSSVTAMVLNKEFRVSVTCDEAGTCFLWDLNTLSYVRTLCKHENPVTQVCVSATLGDIATVSLMERDSRLIVCTINGQLISSLQPGRQITAICYSACPEGVSVNVLVTGFSDGAVQMWSSWDLTPVRVLFDPHFVSPVTSVCFFQECNYLCAMSSEGGLRIWGKKGNDPLVTSNPVTIL